MLLPRWLRALFAWEDAFEAGAYVYQQNAVTGARRVMRRFPGGHSPVDTTWVDDAGWPRADAPPNPPRGGPTERRASIFPHFDVDVPMPQQRKKPCACASADCGTAVLDVSTEILALALMHLPRAYRVIGSDRSGDGFVRLVLESREIAAGAHVQMTCVIEDLGSTRTVTMAPAGSTVQGRG